MLFWLDWINYEYSFVLLSLKVFSGFLLFIDIRSLGSRFNLFLNGLTMFFSIFENRFGVIWFYTDTTNILTLVGNAPADSPLLRICVRTFCFRNILRSFLVDFTVSICSEIFFKFCAQIFMRPLLFQNKILNGGNLSINFQAGIIEFF